MKQAKNEGEPCATLGTELPSQSRDLRMRIRERNPSWSNFAWWCEIFTCYTKFKGQQFEGKFGVLPGVHYLHTIYHFEALEVRSWTLQTVCNLELKRKSYGHLKATAQSWKGISHWHFLMRKFSHWLFPMRKFSHQQFQMRNFLHHLSPMRNFSYQQIQMRNFRNTINHLGNFHAIFRYLCTDSIRFFLKIFLVNYLFPPCNQLNIFLGYLGYLKGG